MFYTHLGGLIQPRNCGTIRTRQTGFPSTLLARLARNLVEPVGKGSLIVWHGGRRLCHKLSLALVLAKNVRRIGKPLNAKVIVHGLLDGGVRNRGSRGTTRVVRASFGGRRWRAMPASVLIFVHEYVHEQIARGRRGIIGKIRASIGESVHFFDTDWPRIQMTHYQWRTHLFRQDSHYNTLWIF